MSVGCNARSMKIDHRSTDHRVSGGRDLRFEKSFVRVMGALTGVPVVCAATWTSLRDARVEHAIAFSHSRV